MNCNGTVWLRSFCLGIFVPLLLLVLVFNAAHEEKPPIIPPTEANDDQPPSISRPQEERKIMVLHEEEQIIMNIESYLIGVVLAEMPASFHVEALKAQAVAARTYTFKQMQEGKRHGVGKICTDYACCQAYIHPEEYIARGGSKSAVEHVSEAVRATKGEAIVYKGELITATYFSCAGGMTEDAAAVWGADVPYLQSVISPGEENAPVFSDSKSFSAQELQLALGSFLKGKPEEWFSDVTYTAGGGVDIMMIGGIPYKGTTLRTLLNLRSTIFTVSIENGLITFYTRGFGHRVGMSQYGANAMASANQSYRDILTYYYTGTEIVQYFENQRRN